MTHETTRADVAVIGGSGLYSLLEEAVELVVDTPFGAASGPVTVGRFAGRRVAFLARHGAAHTIPPHRLNHRANVWALASLGVRAIIASSAVGALDPDLDPDTFVVPDQLIDRTARGGDTFFDGPDVQHLAFADPFDPGIRSALIDALAGQGERFASRGTTVVIPGPRFSTRAESQAWRAWGGDIVNMTQYPEAALAAELGVGYAGLSFVTDGDAGADEGDEVVDAQIVLARLSAARPRIVAVIADAIRRLPEDHAPRALVAVEASARVLALPVENRA